MIWQRSKLDTSHIIIVSKYLILLISFLFYKYWLLKTLNCISLSLPTVANEPMIREKEQTQKRSHLRDNYDYPSVGTFNISWHPRSFSLYLNPWIKWNTSGLFLVNIGHLSCLSIAKFYAKCIPGNIDESRVVPL